MSDRYYICGNNMPHIIRDPESDEGCPYTYFGDPDDYCGSDLRQLSEAEVAAYKLGGIDAVCYYPIDVVKAMLGDDFFDD